MSYVALNVFIFRLLKHCWTDEEVRVATGDAESNLVVHPLKLNSSYATVRVQNFTPLPLGCSILQLLICCYIMFLLYASSWFGVLF